MIPTKADDATFERYVANIISAWNAATPEDIRHGRAWYPVAHDLAEILGNGDARMGAGVIAALSPSIGWEYNCTLARDASNGNVHGHTEQNLDKVRAILAGTDPEDVLPASKKTGHFYRNIADPSDPDPVTVDRHAHDVAIGETYGARDRGLGCATRYATLAHAYREASRRLGELPNVVQAVTWTRQRRLISGTATRGKLN
jgi:hypothetical protein